MMAAIAAAQGGGSVTLLEKNEKLGKKIYITGKGRCNLTNNCDRDEFFRNLVHNPRFLYSSFSAWDNYSMMGWVEEMGTPVKTERGNRVFPVSDKASDVTAALTRALKELQVEVRLRTQVTGLVIEDGVCRGVTVTEAAGGRSGTETAPGRERRLSADRVIVATGGLSYPSTGSDGDGYRWARSAGHTVTALTPALVPFEATLADGSPCAEMQGLSLKNVGVSVVQGGKVIYEDFGEMLFTHFGVSGPVLLSASSLVADRIKKGGLELLIDWKPALSEEELDGRLLREFDQARNSIIKNVMRRLLPASAVIPVLRAAGVPAETYIHEITREQRQRITGALKSFPVLLTGLRGYNEAIVTQGGISVKEINPATMESKLVPGLYFAGEILDIDGLTGGFNLQIAWATGHAAGSA